MFSAIVSLSILVGTMAWTIHSGDMNVLKGHNEYLVKELKELKVEVIGLTRENLAKIEKKAEFSDSKRELLAGRIRALEIRVLKD